MNPPSLSNPSEPHPQRLKERNRRLAWKLVVVAILMAFFTPVLWYTGGVLCDWAGIGINPGSDRPRSEVRMLPPSSDDVERMP